MVSYNQIVCIKKCVCFHMFFKNSVGFVLSNCLNANEIHLEYEIHNISYDCIQYHIHDTKSCESPNIFLKSCIVFMLSNCVNEKMCMFSKVFKKLHWFHAMKLFKCRKNTFRMWNTQYSIELSVHKQPSVFNTTYTIQSHVNCPKCF